MAKYEKDNSGFSLIELMVVVAIIGILSAIAIPKFNNFKARAYRTDAYSILSGMYTQALSYHMLNGPVSASLSSNQRAMLVLGQGFSSYGSRKYGLLFNDFWDTDGERGFVAWALSNGGPVDGYIDILRINTNKQLCASFDAFKKQPAGSECVVSITAAHAKATGPNASGQYSFTGYSLLTHDPSKDNLQD